LREFLDDKGIKNEYSLSAKKRLIIQKAFEQYWKTGGFPEIARLEWLLL